MATTTKTSSERCPVCGEAMPEAKRDRRVASNGATVCGKASCEERAADLKFRIVGNLPLEIDSDGYDTYSAASLMIDDLDGDFRIEAYR